MDVLEEIAKAFVQDLIEYIAMGGDLSELDAKTVYDTLSSDKKED